MSFTAVSWPIKLLTVCAALGLAAGAADAQSGQSSGRYANNGRCQHNGSQRNASQFQSLGQQTATLQTLLQSYLQQLYALQQSGQLTADQSQTVGQQIAAVQTVLQQLAVLPQSGQLSTTQLQALQQRQAGLATQGTTTSRRRR